MPQPAIPARTHRATPDPTEGAPSRSRPANDARYARAHRAATYAGLWRSPATGGRTRRSRSVRRAQPYPLTRGTLPQRVVPPTDHTVGAGRMRGMAATPSCRSRTGPPPSRRPAVALDFQRGDERGTRSPPPAASGFPTLRGRDRPRDGRGQPGFRRPEKPACYIRCNCASMLQEAAAPRPPRPGRHCSGDGVIWKAIGRCGASGDHGARLLPATFCGRGFLPLPSSQASSLFVLWSRENVHRNLSPSTLEAQTPVQHVRNRHLPTAARVYQTFTGTLGHVLDLVAVDHADERATSGSAASVRAPRDRALRPRTA